MKLSLRATSAALAGLLAATTLLTGCGNETAAPAEQAPTSSAPVTVKHTQGELTLDKGPAQRIVALDLGALDSLNALGVGDRIVGLPKATPLPDSLKKFSEAKYTDVGTLFEPNVETIASLNPDLVVVGFRSAKLYPELSKNFPVIDVTYSDMSWSKGVAQATTMLATATGTQDEATKQIAELTDAIAAAKKKVPADAKAIVAMTSAGKVSLHGTKSRYSALFDELGIAPALTEVKEASHGDPVSFERIAQINPDLMFVVDRDAAIGQSNAAAKDVLNNDLVKSTKAAKNDHMIYLDGSRWYILIHGVDNAVEMINGAVASF